MEYSKLGLTPINEQNPVGEDVKYDEDYEKVESELSKLTSPSASNEIDWELVVKLCSSILENKSKNLLISVYLIYALEKTRGVEGLGDGIKVLADMIEHYWESLYPPLRRIKGRINALAWMIDKLSKELENQDTIIVSESRKDDITLDLKRIDSFLAQNLEEAPLFYNLINIIDTKLVTQTKNSEKVAKEISEDKEEIQEEEKKIKVFEEKKEEKKREKKKLQPMKEEKVEDFNKQVAQLNTLIGAMVETQDYRSELFIINRAFAWLDIKELPFSKNGVTLIAPPDTQEIEILQKLYKEKDFTSLLWAAESRITTYLFWLDLHYFVFDSLKNLGFPQAAQSVLDQTYYFITKLSNLQNLSFSDKTPFASKMTKKWLHSKETQQNKKKKPEFDQKIEEVECNSEGIDKLSKLMMQSSCVEEEVLYNIKLCRCLVESNNEILIKSYTKMLLEKVEKYFTQDWNPKIALDAYVVSVACLKNLQEENSAILNELYGKIALLKPSLIDDIYEG